MSCGFACSTHLVWLSATGSPTCSWTAAEGRPRGQPPPCPEGIDGRRTKGSATWGGKVRSTAAQGWSQEHGDSPCDRGLVLDHWSLDAQGPKVEKADGHHPYPPNVPDQVE